MRRLRRRMTAVLTALLLLTLLIPWGLAEPAPGPHQTTVLFTHDLHSHFLPLERADGGESGGYARLASACLLYTSAALSHTFKEVLMEITLKRQREHGKLNHLNRPDGRGGVTA